jgi:hypothetical protein
MDPQSVERRVAALATKQGGVVSAGQALAAGLSRQAIKVRVRAGRWHSVHRGVYAVGHTALAWRGRAHAALLACGPTAVLSHGSAAYAWDLPGADARRIDVSVPGPGGRTGHDGVRIHRAASLLLTDRTTLDGLPVTTVERTLNDLAPTLTLRRLTAAVEAAEARGLLDHARLTTSGRPGAPRLREAIQPPLTLTRSVLEDRFLALCARHRLPRPLVNARVGGLEVDFLWPEHGLVVETDGFAHHRTRAAFEEDRRRDQLLATLGLVVLRFTHRQVADEPDRVGAVLRSRLG